MFSVGIDNIEIVELAYCDQANWQKAEQELIEQYHKLYDNLLNLQKGGSGVITKEQRDIDGMERSRIAHCKKVVAIDEITQNYIIFSSITEGLQYFKGSNVQNISNVLRGKTKTAYNHIWVYFDKFNKDFLYLSNKNTTQKKPVYCFDYNGNLIFKFDSLKNCCAKFKIGQNTITYKIAKKEPYKGYIFSFNKNINLLQHYPNFKYKITNLITNEISYLNYYYEISKIVNISKTNISMQLRNKQFYVWNSYKVEHNK